MKPQRSTFKSSKPAKNGGSSSNYKKHKVRKLPSSLYDQDEYEDDGVSGIEFGTLAKAQHEMESKYGNDEDSDDEAPSEDGVSGNGDDDDDDNEDGRKKWKPQGKDPKHKRANKHAPSETSVRKRVSVVRDIPGLDPVRKGAGESEDIRFDTALGRADLTIARKNYAFLDKYREDEVAALKEALREAEAAERANAKHEADGEDDEDYVRLPTLREREKRELKRKIQSLEGTLRTMKARDFETSVVSKYKNEVKSGARQGPLHLKRSDTRKLVLAEKYKVMKKKDIDRAVERKRKRNTARERKLMPEVRRG
ncbi:uncharacterized protein SAPINGB_P005792 [Magnusiomyces paraingens]|uniref:rRNA biogenesis protein RRP36 n=1 Tax=Magnusiomyces paraingens TaxID=2606893 RepID=A0A5E8C2R2_9ASCO|nr:uncharacterized protein SAPINGB_P005792 [Saprochaete ingens]VVT57632.1 unnamed protein product [Saprochaete ingens]